MRFPNFYVDILAPLIYIAAWTAEKNVPIGTVSVIVAAAVTSLVLTLLTVLVYVPVLPKVGYPMESFQGKAIRAVFNVGVAAVVSYLVVSVG